VRIQIGTSPLDIRLFDDEGNEIKGLKISRLSIEMEGGAIPRAELRLELWDKADLVVADFDLRAAADLAISDAVRYDGGDK